MTVQVQPGDFCVLPVLRPAGPLIEWAQWAQFTVDRRRLSHPQRYEHAEVYLGDGVTASAYPNRQGIRALPGPPEQVPGALWSSGIIPLTSEQREGIVAWCYDHAHVPYSALDYGVLVLHSLGLNSTWAQRSLQRKVERQQSLICSQYVDTAYLANGVHLFTDDRWPGFVDPLDLALLLEARR
jgi:hypothetical protein